MHDFISRDKHQLDRAANWFWISNRNSLVIAFTTSSKEVRCLFSGTLEVKDHNFHSSLPGGGFDIFVVELFGPWWGGGNDIVVRAKEIAVDYYPCS